MAAFLDACRFNPTLGGTTDWTYSSTVQGYQSPAAANVVNGRLYKYRAESGDLSQWELGEGAYNTATGVLARTTVLFNSLGTTAKVNFTAPPQVSIVALKEDLISVEEANSFTAAQKSQLRANMDLIRFNYIINGAMMISQENGSTAGANVSGYYPADCWTNEITNAGAWTYGQVASLTPGGSPNRLRFTVTAADASVGANDLADIVQKIEGYRVADLKLGTAAAKTFTVQFGVKAPAGTYCVVAMNATANRSYVAEYVIAGGEANTDVVKSVTIPGDQTGAWLNNNGIGLFLRFGLMAGSTFQQAAGSWGTGNVIGSSNQFNIMGTLGNVFELFDVGLYEGTVAPAFKVPDYQTELVACQRYFYPIVNGNGQYVGTFQCYSTTQAFGGWIPYGVTMAKSPAIVISNVAHFALTLPNSSNSGACSVVSLIDQGTWQAARAGNIAVPSGLTAGNATHLVSISASAKISADARV